MAQENNLPKINENQIIPQYFKMKRDLKRVVFFIIWARGVVKIFWDRLAIICNV
jgi:hypothetical protein